MSTPVVTDKWAGNFDCDFCRRKRLVGSEFSTKALEKYRKTGGKLKCKQCTQQQEEDERKAAAAKRATQPSATADDQPAAQQMIVCKACQKSLDASHFNKNQWSKGDGKARCRPCVEESFAQERHAQQSAQVAKLQAAKDKLAQAQASGQTASILKAESELAALEAETVTGLKPVKMSAGRGRGRGARGRGRGGGRL